MKILHIINSLGSGGAEKLLEDILPIMNNIEGIQVDLLLLNGKANVFGKELKKNGLNIDIIPMQQLKNPLNIFYIRKHIIENKYDIIHSHLFPTIYWVSIASRLILRNKPKFFYTEHSTHNKRRNKNLLRPIEKLIYSKFDKIISISKSTQENLINWIKPSIEDMEKFIVINNGIDIDKFMNAVPYKKEQINDVFADDTKIICMVGRFSDAKDQPTIIKAMKKLPEYVHLILVGEGPLKENNEKLADDIGISGRVHFLGFRSDIERILKTADIIIQSSNWEGFGLAAVEGMAAGKPSIASDIEGLRDVVGGAGILFMKNNSEQLGNMIKELIINENKYQYISQRCLNRSKLFNIDRMVKEYMNLYYK